MKPPKIDSYRFGEIIVDGQIYNKDLILLPSEVRPNWWRTEGHSLSIVDLQPVLETPLDVLVIGQGAYGRMVVPQATGQALAAAGVEVIAERTSKACETYNRLLEEKRVGAALHLTC